MTETRIPIQNIYFILCYAWKQLDEAGRLNVDSSEYSHYVDLFARVLSRGCSYLFKRGIDREYIPEKELMTSIKGKIDFTGSLNSIMNGRPHLLCEFDELSSNVLPNQIIKAVIRKLLTYKSLDKKIHIELKDIFYRLNGISDLNLSRLHFKKVNLHRNNLFYRFVLNVAFIIHESIVLNEETGDLEFVDFVRDREKMAGIFEAFVRNFYQEKLKPQGYEVKPEILKWDISEIDEVSLGFLPDLRTDISISMPNRKIIIDTKYYEECFNVRFDKKKLISNHLYQLIEYCENSDAASDSNLKSEGMLLYPSVNNEEPLFYPDLRGRKIFVKFLNLDQVWRKIAQDLESFIL